ncbi:MAG: hypothetical protein OEM53_00245 [Nitrosopumilus sp.]|nr:hypothetical protein [Nitrosopumilus sp.]MDH5553848.1 hypothetical protein [Nitrosopumilus sp.]
MKNIGIFREWFARAKIYQSLFFSLLFSPLFFYFVWKRPEIPYTIMIVLYLFWILSLLLDMKSTLSIKEKIKRHEANFLFRILYTKLHSAIAVMLQLFIEVFFIMLFPIISTIREAGSSIKMDWTGSAILGGIVGVLHVIAWYQNKKTIKQVLGNNFSQTGKK